MQLALAALLPLLGLACAAPTPAARTIAKRSLPRLGGVNIAGCDFGMDTSGDSGTSECPDTTQITHFFDDGANAFRLPVGWQYLVGSTTDSSSTSLDADFFATYDALVTAATGLGAYALIDIHNYARWNGGIIGQGGPSDSDFESLWTLLATEYKDNELVMFGIMNEPHDLDITTWATTCQGVVNAIRAAGATTQTIVIPGNGYDTASDYYDDANDALLNITDPATGDTSLLIFDVHKYLDSDGSGSSSTCTTNGVDTFTSLATWLRAEGRQAIVSEIGAGDNSGCITDLSGALDYLVENDDVFVGFTIWAAGSFATDYTLSVTPDGDTDNALWVSAVEPYLPSGTATAAAANTTASATSASSSAVITSSAASPTSTSSLTSVSTAAASSSSAASNSAPSAVATTGLAGVSSVASYSSPASSAVSSGLTSETAVSASFSSASSSPSSTTFSPSASSPASTSATGAASSSVSAPSSDAYTSSASTTASAETSQSSDVSTTVTTTTTAAAASGTGTNLQTYTGALGGISAPAVYASGTSYTSDGQTYNNLLAALDGSCYDQMNSCQLAANEGGNTGDLTVSACEGAQVSACLAAAAAQATD
ncbi:hypothetical protein Q5752_005390 [Cryptotrichosporon argae]